MSLNRTTGYSFRYFTGEGKFTKKDIITKLMAFPEASAYLPEDTKPEYLTRNFLLYVLFIIS